MTDCSDIVLADVDDGGLVYATYSPPRTVFCNVSAWIERALVAYLTHEDIHHILDELEDYETAHSFDNIFGTPEPTYLLVPDVPDWKMARVERLWRRLTK